LVAAVALLTPWEILAVLVPVAQQIVLLFPVAQAQQDKETLVVPAMQITHTHLEEEEARALLVEVE